MSYDPYGIIRAVAPLTRERYTTPVIEWAIADSSEVLDNLDPVTRSKFLKLYLYSVQHGMLPLYFSGFRSLDKQYELYKEYQQGGNIAAPPGRSMHNYGRAVDLKILSHDGRGSLGGGLAQFQVYNDELGTGLTWGKSFNDPNHFADKRDSIDELVKTHPDYLAWLDQHPEMKTEADWNEQVNEEQQQVIADTETFWIRNKNWIIPTGITTLTIAIVIFISHQMKK